MINKVVERNDKDEAASVHSVTQNLYSAHMLPFHLISEKDAIQLWIAIVVSSDCMELLEAALS